MVTAGTSFGGRARTATNLPGRRYDHLFFSGMALLSLATVSVGFSRTYYLAGLFHAPLDAPLVHVHGAVFSCWILLLVVQTSLVAAGRVDVHRRIGIAGFILVCLLVVLGVLVNNHALAIGGAPPDGDGAYVYFLGVALMVIFAVLICFAFRYRSNPAAHKRLILVATMALLVPAIVRLPLAFVQRLGRPDWLSYTFFLMLVGHDLWSTRKIHRATFGAGAFLIVTEQMVYLVGHTAESQAFAGWIQSIVR